MNFENLLRQGKIKPIRTSSEEIKEILSLADRDIKMASFVITQDWDWAFSIAYNASLQASRAYMHSKGYRASSNQGHKNTFEFMKIALGEEHKDLIGFLDRMRPKRNRAIYDISGSITETEVKELLEKSKQFVQIINEILPRNIS
ncbi:HEPN domain-containing protein [Candidatus Omnitrophota bacterium]